MYAKRPDLSLPPQIKTLNSMGSECHSCNISPVEKYTMYIKMYLVLSQDVENTEKCIVVILAKPNHPYLLTQGHEFQNLGSGFHEYHYHIFSLSQSSLDKERILEIKYIFAIRSY